MVAMTNDYDLRVSKVNFTSFHLEHTDVQLKQTVQLWQWGRYPRIVREPKVFARQWKETSGIAKRAEKISIDRIK